MPVHFDAETDVSGKEFLHIMNRLRNAKMRRRK